MNVVNVVVTCTKDKKFAVSDECKLRNVPGSVVKDRLSEWKTRLARHRRDRVPVKDLYAGDHWANVRSFGSSHFDLDIWVCSAGYGLVRYEDVVTPYAATFSSKHPDSVAAGLREEELAEAAKQWWTSTTKWKAHFQGRPRSLSTLMAEYPRRSLLVVTSKTYLNAIHDDLVSGIGELRDPSQLSIVCAGVQNLEGLQQHLVPCDARFQKMIGGARRSLNTRLAKKIIAESRTPPMSDKLSRRYRKLLESQPPIDRYDREPMSDDEVKNFIREQLVRDLSLKHTPLLRLLRETNRACEQKRFAALYRQVSEEIDG